MEVRVFYDDMGSIGFINTDFVKKMETIGDIEQAKTWAIKTAKSLKDMGILWSGFHQRRVPGDDTDT